VRPALQIALEPGLQPRNSWHPVVNTSRFLRVPSASPLQFIRVTLIAFVAVVVTMTKADADLWGHLRFGLDVLADGSLHAADPYSFTSDRTWINHEWLAELLMALAYNTAGPAGLALLKLGVIAGIVFVFVTIAREENASPFARDVYVALAVFATYSRTQVVRPQMFSVLIFLVVLYLLRRFERDWPRAVWFIPVCFGLWANLHGGWFVGLAGVSVWVAVDAIQSGSKKRTLILVSVLVLSALATAVNPYTIDLWRFLGETVRGQRSDITDWAPLLKLPAAIIVIECILPIFAIAAFRYRPVPIKTRDLAVIALLLVGTFRVGRVDAFLQSAIAITLAPHLIDLFRRFETSARASFLRRSPVVGLAAAGLAVYASFIILPNLTVVHVKGPWLPDRAAARYLRDERPDARVLTWFDWGEYAIWHLSPSGIRVSMDGRRETVYSERVIQDHMRFYRGESGMVSYPDHIGADHIWLPSQFPIIASLKSAGWQAIFDNGQSVILARGEGPNPRVLDVRGDTFFPWP
jgi:hypothetical protein